MAEQKTRITITTEDLWTIPKAAKELGIHFTTIYRWIEKGKVHPFRIGGQVFVTVDEIRVLKQQRGSLQAGEKGGVYEGRCRGI